MSEEITRLASIRDEKKAELQAVSAEQQQALDAAKQQVIERFRERMETARQASVTANNAFETALREEKAKKSHPWEGRKVTRTVRKRRDWRTQDVQEIGIVEVRRPGTILPENIAWHDKPDYGVAFVRLLKADGKPGKAISKLGTVWKLVDAPEEALPA